MNRTLGLISAVSVGAAIVAFAASMMAGQEYASYATSMVLSWAYVPLACSFSAIASSDDRAAGQAGAAFATLYAGFVTTVYFVQLTTVLHRTGSVEILSLVSYQELGSLMFNLDLLGYGFMALSTLFIGLTIATPSKVGWWLKLLLIGHGAFAPICVVLPILNIFGTMPKGEGGGIGVTILTAWCAYFLPISILAFIYLRGTQRKFERLQDAIPTG
jgi:hypothetical protein